MNYLQKAEKALDYLQSSEEEYARLKALVKSKSDRLKIEHSTLMLECTESSVAAKSTNAYAHPDYTQSIDSFETVERELYEIQEKRHRAELTIEFWRSLNAAQKLGNPT